MVKLKENILLLVIATIIEILFKYIPVVTVPFDTRVSFGLLFVIVIGFKDGLIDGIIYGIIFGLINYIIDFNHFNVIDLLVNYILAFSVVGLAGFFRRALNGSFKQFAIGISLIFLSKYFINSIGGLFIFKPENVNIIYFSLFKTFLAS